MRRSVLFVVALVALASLAGCNRSRRACDRIAALEAAEAGPAAEGDAILEQLARTQREICIAHLDLFQAEGDAAYAEALACADLPTAAAARQCLDRLSQPPGAAPR